MAQMDEKSSLQFLQNETSLYCVTNKNSEPRKGSKD
jgi:hypothetical protein